MEFVACGQSCYREVPRWEIFMEQELRFGLDLGSPRPIESETSVIIPLLITVLFQIKTLVTYVK